MRARHIGAMGGRVKRMIGLAEAAARAAASAAPPPACALCGRPLGRRTEWHHVVPKSEGGTETVPVHPICHRAIHAHVTNRDLAGAFADLDVLRARDDIVRFVAGCATSRPTSSRPHAARANRVDGFRLRTYAKPHWLRSSAG